MPTYPNLDFQNFYETTLSNDLAIGATDVFLTVVPTPTEGFLTIDPEGANPEIIWYSSKTSSKVVCPAGGRGFDGTTAQAWTSGTKVIMAPVAETQRQIIDAASTLTSTVTAGWIPLSQTVGAVTYNGQRSYNLTMSSSILSTLSLGMRLRTRRTVSAPTQCTSLNGSSQYFDRASASVTGMTFTDDFVVSAWVKLTSYPVGSSGTIIARMDATSANGWALRVNTAGQLLFLGLNAGTGNYSQVSCYQSLPLNKWVHISAQLDMSAFTATPTTSYIMLDGVDIPCTVARSGTNPTTLVNTGNLAIGREGLNPVNYFPGKIAQAAVFSAKVTQATIRGYISQGLLGTETNLVSAYSFNNSINDLNTTNANNLTAQGSATATNADSPFTLNSFGAASGTLDFGIVTGITSATEITVQVPEGCAIPTSGGISEIHYSTQKVPYNFPAQTSRWELILFVQSNVNMTTGSTTVQNPGGLNMTIPIGSWDYFGRIRAQFGWATAGGSDHFGDITNSSTTMNNRTWSTFYADNMVTIVYPHAIVRNNLNLTTATQYYILCRTSRATSISAILLDANMVCVPSTL